MENRRLIEYSSTPYPPSLDNPIANNSELSIGGGDNPTVSSNNNPTATMDALTFPTSTLFPNLTVNNATLSMGVGG